MALVVDTAPLTEEQERQLAYDREQLREFGKFHGRLLDTTLHPLCLQHQDKPEFVKSRDKFWATASMIGAALAVNPYVSLQAWLDFKRVGKPLPVPNDYAQRKFIEPGRIAEPNIKKAFFAGSHKTSFPLTLLEVGTYEIKVGPRHQFNLGASPDGLVVFDRGRQVRVLEVKYHASKSEIPMVPFHYWCQVQTQLWTTGIPSAFYVAASGGEGCQVGVAIIRESHEFRAYAVQEFTAMEAAGYNKGKGLYAPTMSPLAKRTDFFDTMVRETTRFIVKVIGDDGATPEECFGVALREHWRDTWWKSDN